MNFFDKLEQAMTETGQGISRKAKEIAETTRLKNLLHVCEESIARNYKEIGMAYYNAHKDDPDCEYANECAAITNAQKEAEGIKAQIAEISSSGSAMGASASAFAASESAGQTVDGDASALAPDVASDGETSTSEEV